MPRLEVIACHFNPCLSHRSAREEKKGFLGGVISATAPRVIGRGSEMTQREERAQELRRDSSTQWQEEQKE